MPVPVVSDDEQANTVRLADAANRRIAVARNELRTRQRLQRAVVSAFMRGELSRAG